ncbi:MAG: peptidylprolyl isomerase [Chakrabartia sp.]
MSASTQGNGSLQMARIATDMGEIVVELRPDVAPRSVTAFVAAAKAGRYDGGQFCRIVRRDNDNGSPIIEVIQGVCNSTEAVKADLEVEPTSATGLCHCDGAISLPRMDGGPGTALGFFICIGEQPALDAGGGRTADGLGFTAFGHVVEGMEIVRAVHALPTKLEAPDPFLKGQIPVEPPAILSIRIDGADQ